MFEPTDLNKCSMNILIIFAEEFYQISPISGLNSQDSKDCFINYQQKIRLDKIDLTATRRVEGKV